MPAIYEDKGNEIITKEQTRLTCSIHFHNHIELVYLLSGRTRAYSDHNEVLLEAGDLFLAFPNQIHYFRDLDEVKCIIFIFPPELCSEFASVFSQSVPVCPAVRRNDCGEQVYDYLRKIIACNSSGTPYHETERKAYFLLLLSEIFKHMAFEPVNLRNTDTLRSILRYCLDHYRAPLTLEQIADELHINKYHISHLFSQKIKIGFNDFLNTLRIEDACEALAEPQARITDVAFSVGFSSIRSFNRAFAKQCGLAPTAWRRAHLCAGAQDLAANP